ncbi:acetyltransferase (GNAT) family protein [Dysgonomonas alginatilytica]|uniref:Acetyltransferase (GNAT) family protein n=1 Tax=Dysgonomonas alginatilytica TaxID=1605892 RepID=A0A2V3PNR6_9BACT|nr:GNAT family N-acetyltransferase [Dysgonomonas alginatilytica]PXV62325.1 acetyltransferase (GNAT) family protein [Dysgonomonas alginatilytica]
MVIEKAIPKDIDELEALYNDLNDYLEANVNYPGWIKHIYPVRETAIEGIKEDNLFVLRTDGIIAGSVILNNEPEKAYDEVEWGIEAGYDEIIVVHTLVINPKCMQKGVALELMNYAQKYAVKQNMKSIRLDVSVNNVPAIALYEKLGYKYIGTVDLGLNYDHLKWFRLYEKLL